MRWSITGKDDAAEADPSLELEMTSTSTSTSTNLGQHNPMLSLADATATSTTPIGVTLEEDETASQVVVEIASTSHGTVAEQENPLHAAAAAAGALVSTQLVHDKGVSSNTTGGTELNDDDSGRDSTVIGGHEWSTGGSRERRSSFSVASLGAFARTRPGADGGEVGREPSHGASGGAKGRAAKRRSSLDFSWKATMEGFNAGATGSSNAFGGGDGGGVDGGAAEEGERAVVRADTWVEHTTEDGQVYFHNTLTDETSWTKPTESTGVVANAVHSELTNANTPTSLVTRAEPEEVAGHSFEL